MTFFYMPRKGKKYEKEIFLTYPQITEWQTINIEWLLVSNNGQVKSFFIFVISKHAGHG